MKEFLNLLKYMAILAGLYLFGLGVATANASPQVRCTVVEVPTAKCDPTSLRYNRAPNDCRVS